MITLDSNILVYVSDDRFPEKQTLAGTVVRALSLARYPVSLQVVSETQNALRRGLKFPPSEAASAAREILMSFALVRLDRTDVEIALDQMEMGRLSYWDALLLSTVSRAGCTAILTEDMQDGATILGVEIVNPFGPDGLSARASELLADPVASGGDEGG